MSVFSITVLVEGKQVDPHHGIQALDVAHEVNRVAYAHLSYFDGSPSRQEFALSNSGDFAPGKEVEIKIRREGDAGNEATIFEGVIIKHAVEADADGAVMHLELRGHSFRMTRQRKNRVFRDMTDDQAIAELLKEHGIASGATAKSAVQHPELVQHYCNDWDFMLSRAEANGFWVHDEGGKVNIVQPDEAAKAKAEHLFRFGIDDMMNLHLEIDAGSQVGEMAGAAWDLGQQAPAESTAPANGAFKFVPGDLSPADLAAAAGAENALLQSGVPMPSDELQAWVEAGLQKSRLAMVRGSFTIPGRAGIKLAQVMEIGGIGGHFNGEALISAVRHRISGAGWFTDVQFGAEDVWFTEKFEVAARPAGGLLPPVHGLQVGKVADYEEDPELQFRVKVHIPTVSGPDETVWARLGSLDAGDKRGFFFYPEAGDEVVVGFMNDDPRHAVILASLYSAKAGIPIPGGRMAAANAAKGIYTRSGLALKFDDVAKTLVIRSSERQQIVLNQSAGFVELSDGNGNALRLDAQGITISSATDLTLDAKGKVAIKGAQVDIQ